MKKTLFLLSSLCFFNAYSCPSGYKEVKDLEADNAVKYLKAMIKNKSNSVFVYVSSEISYTPDLEAKKIDADLYRGSEYDTDGDGYFDNGSGYSVPYYDNGAGYSEPHHEGYSEPEYYDNDYGYANYTNILFHVSSQYKSNKLYKFKPGHKIYITDAEIISTEFDYDDGSCYTKKDLFLRTPSHPLLKGVSLESYEGYGLDGYPAQVYNPLNGVKICSKISVEDIRNEVEGITVFN